MRNKIPEFEHSLEVNDSVGAAADDWRFIKSPAGSVSIDWASEAVSIDLSHREVGSVQLRASCMHHRHLTEAVGSKRLSEVI